MAEEATEGLPREDKQHQDEDMTGWAIAKTWQASEFRVQEDLDRLAQADVAYCPTEYRVRAVSRYSSRLRATAVPLLPRTVFVRIEYPHEGANALFWSILGYDGLVPDHMGVPQTISDREMDEFRKLVDRLQAVSLRLLEANRKPKKQVKIRSFAEAKEEIERRIKEYVDAETGEIYTGEIYS